MGSLWAMTFPALVVLLVVVVVVVVVTLLPMMKVPAPATVPIVVEELVSVS